MTGRIWDGSNRRFVDGDTLVGRLVRARFVLLGEKHDNPDHHRLQAQLLRKIIGSGRRPAVGFEMFNVDDAFAIARHLAAAPRNAAGLGPAVNWSERGWPDWKLYQPIVEAALGADLPIVATDLRPAILNRLRHGGAAALDNAVLRQLELDRPLSKDTLERMTADIRSAHCGYASKKLIMTMVNIQRARDAQIAQSLMAAAHVDGAVLIAGAGHVRKDYGVPTYLNSKATGQRVISLAFLEVDGTTTEPESYAQQFNGIKLPFDYVWFTPRLKNLDPCESFEAELNRLKKTD